MVASRAIDHIAYSNGGTEVLPGGPARYIIAELDRRGVVYQLITGAPVEVEVASSSEGETYRIAPVPRITLPSTLSGPVILSPIMREIDPADVPPAAEPIFIDLQGFVRQPRGEAPLVIPDALEDLLSRARVVKASREEWDLLPATLRRMIDHITVVTTQGPVGAELRHDGQVRWIAARPVEIRRAIGAGDTFLAAMAVEILAGQDDLAAAQAAARSVESMLSTRAAEEG
ncbi:MAG: PfkB family carbohydrate kinase [Chloroflexota bacterium]